MSKNDHRPRRAAAAAGEPAPAAEPLAATEGAPVDAAASTLQHQFALSLKQAQEWLQDADELGKLQLNSMNLAAQRLQELQHRAQAAGAAGDTVALQLEWLRFQAAASVRLSQDIMDLMVRRLTRQATQWMDGWGTLANALQPPAADSPLAFVHTGIQPLDDLFGAALNRELVPPPEAPRPPSAG